MILAFVLEYAITSEPIETPNDCEDGSPLYLGSTSSLQEYCLATSLRSLRDLEELIEPTLAFRFLNPLESHFEALHTALSILAFDGSSGTLSSDYYYTGFWDVDWHEPTKNSKTAILANLLLMECFSLANDFIQDLDIGRVLQETLYGSISTSVGWMKDLDSGEFECNLVELLAHMREFDKDMLDFFQREARGLVCYTDLLPRYMPGHAYETVCESSCVLPRLLQLGANPDPKGFLVTPLQIAVFSRDLAGVRTLLEAGADLNNIGDEQGIKRHAETSILSPYRCLHGLTPLYILRHLEAYPDLEGGMSIEDFNHMNGATTTDIERLLLDYEAPTVSMGE